MHRNLVAPLLLLLALALAAPAPAGAQVASPWSLHAQLTYQLQGHGSFTAPYAGSNSFLDRKEIRGSYTTTFFVGRRLWKGGELYGNLELLAGAGVSRVLGLAAPPNGETYRVDSTELKENLARLFLRQTWELGGAVEPVADGLNAVTGTTRTQRLTLTIGKFSGTDVFDANTYSHDARTQFNNWSLWANAAWDYPADTRGYTLGFVLEWYRDAWALRIGSLMEPKEANQLKLDYDVRHAHGDTLEVEHRHEIAGHQGAVRLLAFANHARMGVYRAAIDANPAAPDVVSTRARGRTKYGFGLNVEQALTPDAGLFLRAGWNDGRTESWAFTEIERTLVGGFSMGGAAWHRSRDHLGVGAAINGINRDHRDYFAAGGYGWMLGDGRLRYSPERVLDAYYGITLGLDSSLSFEVQRFGNPAFNADRGPVTVYGVRLHFQR